MNIPWAKPYIGKEEWKAAKTCFETGWLSMGKKVSEFEALMSKLVKIPYAIAVNSGTAALDVALKLIGIERGDEVIIPALSYIATGNAVLYQHAIPVFADIDRETYTILPDSAERRITRKTKAVIAIDYAGQAADYETLRKILKNKNIFLIEDGAPSFGGKYKDKPLCSIGDIGIASFHMAKSFTSVEGGMLFVRKKEWADKAKMMRSQGENPYAKYHHPVLGHNYRMTDLHAAIGLEQIKRCNKVLKKREKTSHRYSEAFKGLKDVITPRVKQGNKHAWFLYPVLIRKRNKVALILKEKGIETNISWPMPIYEQEIYKKYTREKCPTAKRVTESILCLPMYYEITEDEQDYVIDRFRDAVRNI